ncbi:hypothetical protein KIW84_033217 [Lathyrus oleraceus]|uniref:Uncharacterized protein n=1 Tax=Pisum sativum TaxID=3888 RepID=A0A9D5B3F3_PEA|nr:hypothetical protein KIW84_033217 [Pisum sativum]
MASQQPLVIVDPTSHTTTTLPLSLPRRYPSRDGIEVSYSPRGYLLSQSKYIASILGKDLLSNTRVVNSPFEINVNYASFDGAILPDPTLYRTLVGILVHLTIIILDIAYEVRVVGLFVVSTTTLHLVVILRTLCYI